MDLDQHKGKMSGYLEKKGRKRVVSTWKRYWFVLEDRLLLYYRSKDEYDAIHPCKGSINLGPPCTVKSFPSGACSFQIVTRASTFTLRADDTEQQKKWMLALMAVLNQNQNFPRERPFRLSHFRYSLDELFPKMEISNEPLERQNTLPPRKQTKNNEIIERLQKMGAQSYGGSLGTISKVAKKTNSNENVQHRHIYQRISIDSNCSGNSKKSMMIDNENYNVPNNMKSLIIENDSYCSVDGPKDGIYDEPKYAQITDVNKNSVVIENSMYLGNENSNSSSENVYEDLDKYTRCSEPVLKTPESSSQTSKKGKEVKKSRSFIRRMWRRKNKKKERKESLEVVKAPEADEAVQMLSELQNILETKKSRLKKSVSLNFDTETPESLGEASSSTPTDESCPSLPPKTHKSQESNEQSLEQEQVRSLDEILDELNNTEPKTKVKMLIDKFNEADEVILRKHDKGDNPNRHSEDLNKLLEELAKVTSAPIMTPGVTSSLISPRINEEWLKILPRQRRLSEPLYDVPRSLSIHLPPDEEKPDAIPATRFFGPVLPPTDTNELSMTPDSLEVDENQKAQYSYSSHNYKIDTQMFSQSYAKNEAIYSTPKHLSVSTHIVSTCQNIYSTDLDTLIYKNVRNININDEIFEDSLEPCSSEVKQV